MKNITLSMDELLLKSGRKYARDHHTTLNQLIRTLLSKTIHSQSTTWLDTVFDLMDQAKIKSKKYQWKRDDLYDV